MHLQSTTVEVCSVTIKRFDVPALYLKPEAVAKAITGKDIGTFKGWTAAVNALLDQLPENAAMLDGHCLIYRTDGCLCEVFASDDGTLDLHMDANGWPVDCGECSSEAFATSLGCWDSHCSNPVARGTCVTEHVFVLINPSQKQPLEVAIDEDQLL